MQFGVIPIWIIGGTSFSTTEITQSSKFHSPTVNDSDTVLTVYSVSEQTNRTTFQCELNLRNPVFSPVAILTVLGKLLYQILLHMVPSNRKFASTYSFRVLVLDT